jgi:UDP-N-acetylmuramate--alanine ligase
MPRTYRYPVSMTDPASIAAPQRPARDRFHVATRHVYMVGIGGCGMAGLARMLKARGALVAGSDMVAGETTRALAAEGIEVGFDQSKPWLPDACEVVVASAAIKPDHPQMLEAQRRGIPTLTYAEALGRCMLGRTAIAVAGTHGKSTTTAMLGASLTDAGLDPTVIVGATCAQLGSGCLKPPGGPVGFRLGSERIPAGSMAGTPGILLAESCEFNRSFHNYRPLFASISSVEADHLDVYGSLDEVVKAFHEFARLVAPAAEGGVLLIAHEGANRREVTAGLTCKVETIGFSPEADWVIALDPASGRVNLSHLREPVADWTMTLPGPHNAVNAATALALGTMVGADARTLARSLAAFGGVDRRMHFLGERKLQGGVVRVYDDYGHHPTEVATTLRALRDHERPCERGGRLICVFQPHQHSRTRHLMEEFATAFGAADVVIVPHIYFVRDSQEERHKVTAADLVDRLRQRGVQAMHLYPFEAIVEQLQNVCRPGDLLVTMGAGPVNQVALGYLHSGAIRPSGSASTRQ